MIERAARDPAIDVPKLKELLAIHNTERDRTALGLFAEAMTAAQSEMEPVRRDMHNSQTRSRYASYVALDRAIRPIYVRHGFSLTYNTEAMAITDMQRNLCEVWHRGGGMRRYQFDLPIVTAGPKGGDVMTKTHATMSANTYGKRALLKMVFNISETSDDDDGNAASGYGGPVSDEQLYELNKLMTEAKADTAKFLAYMGVDALVNLPARRFKEAKDALELKKNAKPENA